eukprot:symbB.v1.2.006737.t1/scaffold403.1/size211681/2
MQCHATRGFGDVIALSRALKGRAWQEALHVVITAQEEGLQLDVVAVNSLLRHTPWVLSLQLLADVLPPLRPNIVSISSMIKSCTNHSLWLRSLSFWTMAKKLGMEVDQVASNSMMFAFAQGLSMGMEKVAVWKGNPMQSPYFREI